MKYVLPAIVDPTRTTFVVGRSILHSVLLRQAIVQGYKRKGTTPRVMMKLDIMKAYDSLNWTFIENILKALQLGSSHSGQCNA